MRTPSKNVTLRRDVLAWCCYDWANSGYTTLIITVFVVYFQRVIFSADQWNDTGAVVWAWSVSLSMLIGAFLSPILGAISDAHASKRRWLATTAFIGSAACIGVAVMPMRSVWWITACFVIANICLELSLTVYNGFLPEIAADEEMNRVSSAGMGWGYFGGGLALMLAVALIQFGDQIGLHDLQLRLRLCIAGTGVWWALFTLPTVIILRDQHQQRRRTSSIAKASLDATRSVVSTIREIRRYKTLALFLVAFLFFNDGVQTVISQSSTFALQEVNFTESELLAVILMVQFLAVPGAIMIGRLADSVGQKKAIVACLTVWIVLLIYAWFIQTKLEYWCMAAVLSLVLGGTQSVSRAIMGVLTPPEHSAKFFGFFNMSGKATSFMGTFVFGLVIAWTGSSRLAVVFLVIFFAVGLILILLLRLPDVQRSSSTD